MEAGIVFDFDFIQRHAAERIAAAEIIFQPFPYTVIEDILPDDYFDYLIAARPDADTLGVPLNQYFNFAGVPTDPHFARIPPEHQKAWVDFSLKISLPVYREALLSRFAAFIPQKLDMMFGEGWISRCRAAMPGKSDTEIMAHLVSGDCSRPASSLGRLIVTRGDYPLPPHVDDCDSVFTMVNYFAPDNRYEH